MDRTDQYFNITSSDVVASYLCICKLKLLNVDRCMVDESDDRDSLGIDYRKLWLGLYEAIRQIEKLGGECSVMRYHLFACV